MLIIWHWYIVGSESGSYDPRGKVPSAFGFYVISAPILKPCGHLPLSLVILKF